MANLLSVPVFVPDITSSAIVAGYQVQYNDAPAGMLPCTGTWHDVSGSPFTSNHNILDTGATTVATYYRARPVLMVGSTALDVAWSKAFQPTTTLYNAEVTRFLLPAMRFVYLHDEGKPQTNGTVMTETSGAGQGVWVPDGEQTRFLVQWVENDDPIRILDQSFTLIKKPASGSASALVPDVDYSVDILNGAVTFHTAPAHDDYLRFDFRVVDFVNDDLLTAIKSGVNGLSHFGINGYGMVPENNLQSLNKPLPDYDLPELIAKIGVWFMREGATEMGLRSSFAWRDGGINVDPYPSRALEFLVGKIPVTEKSLRIAANAYIKGTTRPRIRGDYDVMFDMSQMTPVNPAMFSRLSAYFGIAGAASTGFSYPYWI